MSLLKFLGLPADKPKISKTRAEKDKAYDSMKRKRTIVPSWKTEFSWLVTDDTREVVYCGTCRSVYGPLAKKVVSDKFKKYSKGSFVTGCSNLRHDALTTHGKSEGHRHAVQHQNSHSAEVSIADQTKQKLNTAVFDRLTKLFRYAHYLAKMSRPISDFRELCLVSKKNGVDVGNTYLNDKACKEFLVAIAEVERQKIEKQIMEAHFCTILSDGSRDISVTENEVVYVHFAHQGVTHCYFLGMIECTSASATGIFEAIGKALTFSSFSKNELHQKIVGFAGDGASVNTGRLNGVIAHFQRNISPTVIMIQCIPLRVELAMKDAAKTVPIFKKVFELLDNIFKFYRSPKQKSGLKASFANQKLKSSMPTRVGGTRWVGHVLTALKALLNGYKAVVTHLSQVATVRSQSASQSKAKHFLGLLRSKDIVMFAHFMVDVLHTLTILSKLLQERQACIFKVHQQLRTSLTNLQKLEDREGPELRKVSGCDSFEGETLKGGDTLFKSQSPKLIRALVSCLKGRFTDLDQGVLRATRLADLESWPATYEDACDFGDADLAQVIDHFRPRLEGQSVDVGAAEEEWTFLKQALYESHDVHKMTWDVVNRIYGATGTGRCVNILLVVDLMLSLPAATAECERGFSHMKVVKSQFRNNLKSSSMTLLMTIQLHSSEPADFQPDEAMHRWNKSHHRRPAFMNYRIKKTVPEQLEQAIDNVNQAEEGGDDSANSVVIAGAAVTMDTAGHADSDYESDFSDLVEGSDSDNDNESDVMDID